MSSRGYCDCGGVSQKLSNFELALNEWVNTRMILYEIGAAALLVDEHHLEGGQGVEAHADGGDDDEGDGEEGDDFGGQGGVGLLKQVPQSPGHRITLTSNQSLQLFGSLF